MKVFIKHISYYLPDHVVSNDDIAKQFPNLENLDKLAKSIGVNQRCKVGLNETAGDLAVKAAEKLFAESAVDRTEIDFIIFDTQTPDYIIPTTACIIQDRLHLRKSIGAFDMNLGCSGFVYGLAMAKSLIIAGMAKNVLLMTADTSTKYLHQEDKGNHFLFGDGASACLVSTEGVAGIGDFIFGTDGSGFETLIIRNGGSRHRALTNQYSYDDSGTVKSDDHVYMDGSAIFSFTLDTVPQMMDEILRKNNIVKDDVDLYAFHQANKLILDTIRKVASVPKEKMYINLEKTGNTTSSTIPMAIKNALGENRIQPGMKVMIAGFGVGLSWGGTVLTFE